jgi:benzodiazapine receptor
VKLIISILFTLAAGAIAGIAEAGNINGWYLGLNKPWFNPPNAVFAPVWSALYLMMGIAFYLVWKLPASKNRNIAMVIYFVQLFLNCLWGFLFFYCHAIAVALADMILLWTTILLCILFFTRLSKKASWLMVPYIGWVSFAMVLNISILYLNIK